MLHKTNHMKLIVKLLIMNIVVFCVSFLFFYIAIVVFKQKQDVEFDLRLAMAVVIKTSYAFCTVFTISFFILSSSPVQELLESVER